VGAEPLFLRRPYSDVDARVENDDVPGAHVVAVVALRRIAGGSAEVVVVASGVRGLVVLVTGRWENPRLVSSPGRGRVEAARICRVRPVWIGGVPRREDGARHRIEDAGCLLVVVP